MLQRYHCYHKMDAFRNGQSHSFPSSPSVVLGCSSLFSFAFSSFLSLNPKRRIILVSAFAVGLVLTVIMKREAFLWALTVTAGAAPLLSWKQGSAFDYPGLRFDYDKKFRITMFNDLHLGDQGRPNSDDKTLGVMNNVLNAESGTDLVVLNGDLTSCEWIGPQDVNGTIDKIINPLINRNIPFAATFGNHDMSATCNTRSISEYIWNAANKNGHQLTWTTSTVEGDYNHVGTSNYYIPIYGSRGGGNPKLKMILWFFDSKGGRQYQPGGPNVPVADWVDDKVMNLTFGLLCETNLLGCILV